MKNSRIELGSIVKSISGHDMGSYYAVVGIEGDFVYIANGRRRKLEKPKKKNPRHLVLTNASVKLSNELTDKNLRRQLYGLNFKNPPSADNNPEESDLACLKKM